MNDIKNIENSLGFETESVLPKGLPSEKIVMIQTKNTRKVNTTVEERIRNYWLKERHGYMFDGNRPRLEGINFKENENKLEIFYSHEKFKTYFYAGNKRLSRAYRARPLSINGMVITKDGYLPIGLREDEKIWDVVPAGYIDMSLSAAKKAKDGMRLQTRWCCETPHVAAARELHEELAMPAGCLNIDMMRMIGILFNYSKYYDTAHSAMLVIPVGCYSSEINLQGNEHRAIRFIRVSAMILKKELVQMSKNPSASSGNLRGGIALLIAHLYCDSEYAKTLESVSLEISRSNA